jgi:subtilisin family serine protease
MRAPALAALAAALCLARGGACAPGGAWPEPPWASPAARAAAGTAARDAPAPFLVLTQPGARAAAALADVCNRTAPPWRGGGGMFAPLSLPEDMMSGARPSLGCRLALGGVCRRVYTSALSGFAGTFRPWQLRALHACLPGLMARVEHDAPVALVSQQAGPPAAGAAAGAWAFAAATQPPVPATLPAPTGVPWSLDRLDQRGTPLDGIFTPAAASASLAPTGAGVTVYVLDSGIRGSHAEFASSSALSRVQPGFDFIADALPAACGECNGHGTHVAATVGGGRVGVAPGVTLVCVRVLDCAGSGVASDVVAGLDWIAADRVAAAARARAAGGRDAKAGPAVATLSLGIPRGDWSAALEAAVRSLVTISGVFVTVAAGNSAGDACAVAPAAVREAFTVGASDLAPRFRTPTATSAGGPDSLYAWGDTGACVDIFAPGTDVLSACGGRSRCADVSDTSYAIASGTSMAAPHVAGVAALYLSARPDATPAQVADALLAAATPGRLTGKMLPGTPNLLLYARVSPPAVAASAGVPTTAVPMPPAAAVKAGGAAVVTAQVGAMPMRSGDGGDGAAWGSFAAVGALDGSTRGGAQ